MLFLLSATVWSAGQGLNVEIYRKGSNFHWFLGDRNLLAGGTATTHAKASIGVIVENGIVTRLRHVRLGCKDVSHGKIIMHRCIHGFGKGTRSRTATARLEQ
jgi:hypothetical protein